MIILIGWDLLLIKLLLNIIIKNKFKYYKLSDGTPAKFNILVYKNYTLFLVLEIKKVVN